MNLLSLFGLLLCMTLTGNPDSKKEERTFTNPILNQLAGLNSFINSSAIKVPGTVVDHIPASSGKYIGSPSICILPDGKYVASHDFFGPSSTENQTAVTVVFISDDKGKSWTKVSEINGQFWSNLFEHNGNLYIMGTWKQYGNLVIRASTDGGKTWTEPKNKLTGLLREGEYHTAPVPVTEYNGRLWRAIEYSGSTTKAWGKRFSAMVISAPAGSDLLNADNWISTNWLPYDSTYLGGRFGGWLEGNAVVTSEGKIVDILRVATNEKGRDLVATVNVSPDGKTATFDRNKGFIDFTGGSKKFSIRYDEKTKQYWTIVNLVTKEFINRDAGSVRNTLVIKSSSDLINWTIHKVLLHHPDAATHGFQYIDWQFDGSDIIFLSRTAFDDEFGGAHNYHDANFLTFHRIKNFRKLNRVTI